VSIIRDRLPALRNRAFFASDLVLLPLCDRFAPRPRLSRWRQGRETLTVGRAGEVPFVVTLRRSRAAAILRERGPG
jgi:hypothetical protein